MEELKKYEFNKIKADDVFIMVSIISKIGVNKFRNCLKNEEMQNLMSNLKDKDNIDKEDIKLIAGAGIFLEIAQVIVEGLPKCKIEIYKLLSSTSNLTVNEIENLEGVTFFEMLMDFIKKEEFLDFIKAASRFVKKEN